jgi:hypothetical protein
MIVSPGFADPQISYLSTSRLNPENTFPSRLREEMRLSPCPPSPVSNKRKLSGDDRIPEPLYYRPLKRILKSNHLQKRNSPPVLHIMHNRDNSTGITPSDISMYTPENSSPRLAIGALPLNLSAAGEDFSNMKLS